ncbi:MAG: hypothetical protein AABX39_00240, partial [Nanoarchaeota archaeon]
MKIAKFFLLFSIFLLIFPIVYAGVEEDQLNSIIRQVKDRIIGVQIRNKQCLNNALSVLHDRMDEMVGAQAFMRSITDPVTWARQLIPFRADLAINALQKLKGDVDDYLNEGRVIIGAEYKPGWGRWTFGDECENFNLQFLWLKDLNTVRIISSGDCNCNNDVDNFYIQFDVKVRVNERADQEASNRYTVVGFENVHPYDYLTDSEEESNSVIKVNCCKKCDEEINWEESENKVGFSTPKKDLFTDPDDFLASLEKGTFVPTSKDREKFMRETLCSRIDTIPKPTPTKTPDFTRTPTPKPDPTRTPTPTLPPIIPTKTPTKTLTPTPTLPPVIYTQTPTPTPTSTPTPTITQTPTPTLPPIIPTKTPTKT